MATKHKWEGAPHHARVAPPHLAFTPTCAFACGFLAIPCDIVGTVKISLDQSCSSHQGTPFSPWGCVQIHAPWAVMALGSLLLGGLGQSQPLCQNVPSWCKKGGGWLGSCLCVVCVGVVQWSGGGKVCDAPHLLPPSPL